MFDPDLAPQAFIEAVRACGHTITHLPLPNTFTISARPSSGFGDEIFAWSDQFGLAREADPRKFDLAVRAALVAESDLEVVGCGGRSIDGEA